MISLDGRTTATHRVAWWGQPGPDQPAERTQACHTPTPRLGGNGYLMNLMRSLWP